MKKSYLIKTGFYTFESSQKNIIVCTPSLSAEGGRGIEERDLFQRWRCNFYIRNKLKSEIFNDKKREILAKHLVTLKNEMGLKMNNFDIMGVH